MTKEFSIFIENIIKYHTKIIKYMIKNGSFTIEQVNTIEQMINNTPIFAMRKSPKKLLIERNNK